MHVSLDKSDGTDGYRFAVSSMLMLSVIKRRTTREALESKGAVRPAWRRSDPAPYSPLGAVGRPDSPGRLRVARVTRETTRT